MMSRDFPKMVGWYSPRLLMKAAVEVVVSTLFGQHADQRTVQALMGAPRIADYTGGQRNDTTIMPRLVPYAEAKAALTRSGPGEAHEIWFDYIADLGDGWDSTYSIAWLATRRHLTLPVPGGSDSVILPQGTMLIFGGDQVYPMASRSEYERRFLSPYQSALDDGQVRPHTDVYAIPGNHDWYDSLRSFSRIFFSDGPFVDAANAATETPQTRSYFALRLPSNWWILGTDVQLGSDIDANQLEYFRTVASMFDEQDKVILCTAEPHWINAKKVEKGESLTEPTALNRLEREVLGDRVRVYVAGDIHHYMRFQSEAEPEQSACVHKITAGGGGAFLHPTHRTWNREISTPSTRAGADPLLFRRPDGAVFPSPAQSFSLAFRNWLFALLNPRFGILTAILYVVFALMMMPAFMRYENAMKKDGQTRSDQGAAGSQYVLKMSEFFHRSARPMLADEPPESFFSWAIDRTRFAFNRFWTLSRQELALPDPFQSMLAILVFVSAIGGFIAFTDVPNMAGKVILGTLHGGLHWIAAFLITLLAAPMIDQARILTCVIVAICGLSIAIACGFTNDAPGQTFWQRLLRPLIATTVLTATLVYLTSDSGLENSAVVIVVFVGGWMIGSFIMGGYLFLAHSICGQHWNEAFSSIRVKDWKCFLRFHLSREGELTIYPIGVPRVCRQWTEADGHVSPQSASDLQAILIEKPIVLR